MKALLMPNHDKDKLLNCTAAVIGKLAGCGILSLIDRAYYRYLPDKRVEAGDFLPLLEQADVVIAIGGDGTIIHSAKHAAKMDKLVLGINVGRLGFLAALEPTQLDLLEKLASGDFRVENRMLIQVDIEKKSGENLRKVALNEMVLTRGALSRMIDTRISCLGRYVTEYRSDGIIFCTPTGSTAYSLSAGGPVIAPTMDSIAVTPICPHSLYGRTIIFPPDNRLAVELLEQPGEEGAYVTVDGEEAIHVTSHDRIEIAQAERGVRLINFGNREFYEVLHEKMMNRI